MESRRKSGLSRCGFGFGQQLADEDEMVGWHHQLNGQEFERTLGDGENRGAWRAAGHGVSKSRT